MTPRSIDASTPENIEVSDFRRLLSCRRLKELLFIQRKCRHRQQEADASLVARIED